ncbi:MAG TPA: hypothetical protein VF622_05660 [Segetibacter sp.]
MMNKKLAITIAGTFTSFISIAQDRIEHHTLNYDPDKLKIIPDKVFEFGVPLLFIFLLLNSIISILKNKAEHQLKLKIIEKDVSEDALVKIFKESNAIAKLQPLKWFLFSFSVGISLFVIHLCKSYLRDQSGYLATGIILTSISIAFFIYYQVLNKQIKS